MKPVLAALCLLLAFSNLAWAAKRIDRDTTWFKDKIPYVVEEATSVAKGVTLTIAAGVTVQLAEGVSLTVEGALVARGKKGEQIVFTGKPGKTGTARWGSLIFARGSVPAKLDASGAYLSGSILEQCVLESATRAVQLIGSSPFIHQSIFRKNLQADKSDEKCGAGILMKEGSAPWIVGSTFTGNEGPTRCEGAAIYAAGSAPIIKDNIFRENRSDYGGAVAVYDMYSPIVGNTFEKNDSRWEGGALALVSSSPAIMNNRVVGNTTIFDGGGIHVCTTCFPHANPFFFDNTITGNSNRAGPGAAGLGAAYLRACANNNIHDNKRTDGTPSDFSWLQKLEEKCPSWVQSPSIGGNWWGTTDPAQIGKQIYDGNDNKEYAKISLGTALEAAVTAPQTRVTITTRKIKYDTAGEEMPVFLTIYNPGPARKVDLTLMVQYGQYPPFWYTGPLGLPGTPKGGEAVRIALAANSVQYAKLMAPKYAKPKDVDHGFWHVALFEADSGKRVGEVLTVRFDLAEGGGK